ncbi:ATP-binding protein [Reyranella sp.]|uniref:ATP-binding protein n=1 Tax=Reyranella sp. TaxID=1929291 RepID=UPI00272F742D|nr:ATP-binding protein [Reyranella sp.]MDP2375976.1 PAS domain S-box protein [Reyranella sp.]
MVDTVSPSRAAGAERRRDAPAAAWLARLSIRARVIAAVVAYLVVTLGVLAAVLLQLRGDSLATAERLTGSLTRLAADQTAHALMSVDQTLTIAETMLDRRRASGTLDQAAVGKELRALLKERPFLLVMWVMDAEGRIVFHSRDEAVGTELGDRPYFKHHLAHGGSHLDLGVPLQSRITGAWLLPATKAWRDGEGRLLGVAVAALDPRHFDTVWQSEEPGRDSFFSLMRSDGTLLMRSPFVAEAMGRRFAGTPTMAVAARATPSGVVRSTSSVDGVERLVGIRALAADPTLLMVAGQSVAQVLAPWRHIVGVVTLGWLLSTLGLAMLAVWLVGEWTARQASEARYRQLFEAYPDPMAVFDRDTLRYLAVNDAMVRQYGWSREEFLTMSPSDIRVPEDLSLLTTALASDAPGGRRATLGGRHRRKDGSILDIEVSLAEIEFGGKQEVLAIARDVTERRLAEQAQRAAEDKLRQAQKMEAVGQLTGGVAHDFNNILMVMMANTDALEDDYELLPAVREHVATIAKQTQRAADLTRQLLAFSRKQPLRPQVTDLNALVVATGRLLRRTLGAQVEIDSVLADDLCLVAIDRTQLETALVNLCVNARDAMPKGGRLLLETRRVVVNEAEAALFEGARPGEHALLAVTDSGEGIAPENLDKVFEPFFTTKEVGRGTGLGLSMVYGFIQQSNGHLRIESAPGRGTTVSLYLPRTDEPVQAEGAQAAAPGGRERILVVEDDPKVRGAVVSQLKGLGYAVSEAADGAAGLRALEGAAEPFDLLLTDVIMPGTMNGKALADEAARRWPAMKRVFMSGYTEDAIVNQGRLEPGVLLLSKPFRRADLARMMRQALDGTHSP